MRFYQPSCHAEERRRIRKQHQGLVTVQKTVQDIQNPETNTKEIQVKFKSDGMRDYLRIKPTGEGMTSPGYSRLTTVQ